MHTSKLQNHLHNLGLQYHKKTTQENTSALKIRSCIPSSQHITPALQEKDCCYCTTNLQQKINRKSTIYVSHRNFLSTQNLTLHATHKEKLENELLDNSVTAENTVAIIRK